MNLPLVDSCSMALNVVYEDKYKWKDGMEYLPIDTYHLLNWYTCSFLQCLRITPCFQCSYFVALEGESACLTGQSHWSIDLSVVATACSESLAECSTGDCCGYKTVCVTAVAAASRADDTKAWRTQDKQALVVNGEVIKQSQREVTGVEVSLTGTSRLLTILLFFATEKPPRLINKRTAHVQILPTPFC